MSSMLSSIEDEGVGEFYTKVPGLNGYKARAQPEVSTLAWNNNLKKASNTAVFAELGGC